MLKSISLSIVLILTIASLCYAEWKVTVSGWTMSTGPDLAYEQVLMVGTDMCGNILPGDAKSCIFFIPEKKAQEMRIRSFDTNGNYADNIVGNIGGGPNPSTGGTIILIWQQ